MLTVVLAFSVAGVTEGAVEGTAAAASSTAARAAAPNPGVRAGTPRPSRAPAGAIRTEARLRAAWADPMRRRIDLGADIVLRDCRRGDPVRESPYPLVLDGHGHAIRQSCFENRVLRQDGTGYLDLRRVTLLRGGSDGPGAAMTSRGEITLSDCSIKQNLAEEPGGGIFSMRRVTAHRCHINGNLANDDGGGIYARRGGVQVYDSVLSANLVDGSGGAIASTGDILVVRSRIDANTTDGDGGALYADEDGDVTVIDSLVDGSDADGPGGAIFTLDGDVAVYGSTLVGNRADDRGGAISGEADVLVVNSTIARNLAVAHVGGGIWARGDLVLVNATVTNNYAEGAGGGVMSAGATTLVSSTITRNIGSVAANVGAAGPFASASSIIGPAAWEGVTGDTIPTRRSCRVYQIHSLGYNLTADPSCGLDTAKDLSADDPDLAQLEDDPAGFVLVPRPTSPVRGKIPAAACPGRLPSPLPAGQLLERWVSWSAVLRHDAVGTPKGVAGHPCDIGAVQSAAAAEPGAERAAAARVPTAMPPAPTVSAGIAAPPRARRAGTSGRPTVRAARAARAPGSLRASLRRMEKRLRGLDRGAARFDRLLRCTRKVGIVRAGGGGQGFLYDERDGTGVDLRRALVRTRSGPRWNLLRLSPSRRCASAAPDPNGSGADARVAPRRGPRGVRALRKAFRRLERIEERVEDRTERFDAWESCLEWLPVTEQGDADQRLGYRVDPRSAPGRRSYSPGVDVDRGRWDDPDYQLLTVRPKNRGCGRGPGESADRLAPRRSDADSRADIRQDLRSLREDVEDLVEPVGDIVRFDECAYTVGMRQTSGYLHKGARGRVTRRQVLSFDMRGHRLPRLNVLAFPGEEPPQIECNEDAGGQETDE
ncbi:hypothetical protein KV100_10485 [Mumia sp. zg.B21]|uniref:right-handed parallel beta-helix repeat-containing protein n=1 Tax=Mumia sp. zg.B21 TaxID=2855447 RepID=UPI001C6E0435|nr:right-handed parallel beta-helix repeat-containing protein [Mumia sp. zg.B21]MBW9210087.1 hypothetical protein [Mumia sp. zg.B21]